ncbi:MAG: YceI family protein [Planctomycetes bacterium]|nr:YceI family protein [Planctomycetota bacterium]
MRSAANAVIYAAALLTLSVSSGCAQTGAKAPPANAGSYTIDHVHSTVTFEIEHLGASRFVGRFNQVAGEFAIDSVSPANCRARVEIDSGSVDTNHQGRDEHLRKPEFFDSAAHPKIVFTSERFEPRGGGDYRVSGNFTFLGKTIPLIADLDYIGVAENPKFGFRTGYKTVFHLKLADIGLGAHVGGLGNDVMVTVNIEGIRK